MKKSLRFISLLLAAVFLISGSVMIICSAEVGDGDNGGEAGGDIGGDTGEIGGGGEIGGDSGQSSGGEVGGDNSQPSGGEIDSDTGDEPDYEPGGYESGYESGGYESGYESGGYVYDEDPIYYGDPSNYSYNISENGESAVGSVASNTTLYNSSGMSAAEAAPNEWSDITLDEKTVKTGVSDFSAIKTNTETQDNGDWILYLGYLLLALSALGILYFIAATIAQRSAAKKAARLERRRSSAPAYSTAARMEERERRASGSYQRASRFAEETPGYSRRSSRADTGEVYVPRRAAKRSR